MPDILSRLLRVHTLINQEAIGPEAAHHDRWVQWAIAQCPGLGEVPSCARGPSQDGQGSVRGYELCAMMCEGVCVAGDFSEFM